MTKLSNTELYIDKTCTQDEKCFRVLEIGEVGLFHWGMAADTDAYYASYRADLRQGRAWLGLIALYRIWRHVACGRYDLIVLHPPYYSGWHPRSFMVALKFSLFKGRPLELWGAIISPILFQFLRYFPLANMIAVERSDSFGIPRHHFFLLDKAQAYYKRELPFDHWQVLHRSAHRRLPGATFRRNTKWQRRIAKIHPIALGLDREKADKAAEVFGTDKEYDLFFAGGTDENSTVRANVPDQLCRLRKAGVQVDAPSMRLSYDDYIKRCAKAWITLSPAGLGWDCYRHVEAAIAGSVPLVSAPSIERYKSLVIGQHCLVYHLDADDIVSLVIGALSDKKALSNMAKAAHDHAKSCLVLDKICRELLQRHVSPD